MTSLHLLANGGGAGIDIKGKLEQRERSPPFFYCHWHLNWVADSHVEFGDQNPGSFQLSAKEKCWNQQSVVYICPHKLEQRPGFLLIVVLKRKSPPPPQKEPMTTEEECF
ncbi:hypothetical protein FKM82_003317 [Ascaphus truei]